MLYTWPESGKRLSMNTKVAPATPPTSETGRAKPIERAK
jgi:hypothetical protein